MINRSFILVMLLGLFMSDASAEVRQINYVAKFGIFGTVGMLKTKITKNSSAYELVTDIELRGVAKLILDNHEEQHTSKGHVVNGLMVSDVYTIKQNRGTKRVNKEYTIDHKEKTVSKRV